MEPSVQIKTYVNFIDALVVGDVSAMSKYVAKEFRANLGKGNLNFVEFVAEIDRQRVAFPDLGKCIAIASVSEEDRSIRVVYDMVVHFTGRLTNDKGAIIEPTGKQVKITAVDHVIFGSGGKILEFTVTSNPIMTIEQMFPNS